MLVRLPNDGWSFPPRGNEARIDRGNPLARRLQFATFPDDRPFNLVTKTFCYATRTGAKPVGGESGTALRFAGAGSGDQLRFTDAEHSIGDKYTGGQSIALVPHTWAFRFKAFAVATRGSLLQYSSDDSGNNGLYATLESSDGKARYAVRKFNENHTSTPAYTLNKWHNVVFTYDPVSNKLNSYLDGKRGTEATEASITTNTSMAKFEIGNAFNVYSRELDGEISFFAFWDRALTPSEGRFLTQGDNWLTLFEGEQSVFFPAESVGGSTFNKTATDSFAFSDTPAETAVFERVVADALALSDTPTESATFVRTLADALTLSDATTGSTGLAVFVAESLVFADTVTEAAAFAAAVAEALGLADTATETGVLLRAVIDSLAFTDVTTAEGGEEVPAAEAHGGGSSMTLRQMRRLERSQLLAMIREDDAVIASLVASYLRRSKRLN